MTERQINEQLIKDLNRIFTVTDEWNRRGQQQVSCEGRERTLQEELNAGKEAELVKELEEIIASCQEPVYSGTLSRLYMKYAKTVLNYRIEARNAERELEKIRMDSTAAQDLKKYIDCLNKNRKNCQTVIGYRALELAGSEQALAEAIAQELGIQVKVTVRKISDPGYVYREKEPYLKHKIWVTTQMTPIVVVTKI